MHRKTAPILIEQLAAEGSFREMLERTELGETFVITRDGQPLAILQAYEQPFEAARVTKVIDGILELRKSLEGSGSRMDVGEIRTAIHETRR